MVRAKETISRYKGVICQGRLVSIVHTIQLDIRTVDIKKNKKEHVAKTVMPPKHWRYQASVISLPKSSRSHT